jgi:virginiamycin B lyase
VVITEHQVGLGAYGVAITPDGTVWTTLADRGELVALRPDGELRRVRLDSEHSRPMVITCDPSGSLWFSRGDGAIGHVDAAGSITSQPVLTAGGSPYGLCLGPDEESLWYTLIAAHKIGRITLAGQIITKANFGSGAEPHGLAIAPDLSIWVALEKGTLAQLEGIHTREPK